MQSVKNLGDIFIVLPTFSVVAELTLVYPSRPVYGSTVGVLLVGFFIMPAVGLLFVLATAGRGWYVQDPLICYVSLASSPNHIPRLSTLRFALHHLHLMTVFESNMPPTSLQVLLVFIPAGSSTTLLVNVAELVNTDQGPIARYLTIAHLLSPLMAVVCSLGFFLVQA